MQLEDELRKVKMGLETPQPVSDILIHTILVLDPA